MDERVPSPEAVERALKMQKGTVLANEVARLRDRLGDTKAARDGAMAEVRRLRSERDAVLNMLEGYDVELARRLRAQIAFERGGV